MKIRMRKTLFSKVETDGIDCGCKTLFSKVETDDKNEIIKINDIACGYDLTLWSIPLGLTTAKLCDSLFIEIHILCFFLYFFIDKPNLRVGE